MRIVPISCVKENSTLAQTLYNTKGHILLKKGVALTSTLIEKIGENGIGMIYINDQYSKGEIEEIIKPELKNKAVVAIKEAYEHTVNYIYDDMKKASNIREKNKAKTKEKYIHNLYTMSEKMVDEIVSKTNTMINMVDIKTMDNYTYEHSVNVAVLSLVIGIQLKLNKDDLVDLCVGAMLHDIGKVTVNPEIVKNKHGLSEEEMREMEKHTVNGYKYLGEYYNINARSRVVALQHHEKWDGTGYPRGIAGENIHKFARIVAIADVYDTLTSYYDASKVITPNEAIEYIMGSAGRYYDFKFAESFVRKIVPYPEGSLVTLSNGRNGVVERLNMYYPMRPVIKYIDGNGESVDLMKTTNCTIQKVIYET